MRGALTVSFLWLGTLPAACAADKPDAVTPDGGRYYGALVQGKLHGRGRIEWPNGTVYEGELRDGMMAGRGRFEVPEREVYEGAFRQDEYEGKGRFVSADGDVYEGDFKKSEFTGSGRRVRKDGGRKLFQVRASPQATALFPMDPREV